MDYTPNERPVRRRTFSSDAGEGEPPAVIDGPRRMREVDNDGNARPRGDPMDRELYGPDRPQVYTRERSRDNPGVRFRARTSERSRYGSDDDSDSDSSRPRAPPSPRRRYRSPSRVRSAVSSSRRYHVSRPRSRSVYSDESEEIILRPGGAPPPRDEYDEGASSVIYDFVPSWTGGLSAQTTAFSGTDDDDGVVDGHPAFEGGKSKYPVTNVHESQYTGDGLFGGTHTAGLSTSDSGQPIFRWIHLCRQSMDFVEFSTAASQAANLTKAERKAVIDLLTRVRQKFIKPIGTPSGRYAQHVEPSCIEHTVPSTDGRTPGRSTRANTITWMCLPYFSLEKYSGLDAPDKPAFPVHTLLQGYFSKATQGRDMQQAVSHMAPAGWCLHIPQLWSLVLGNSLLVTCGRMPQEQLCGEAISLSPFPSMEKDAPGSKILVTYGGSVMWSLSVDECSTWLDFITHFLDFWPQPLTFYRHKRPVKPREWAKICHMAKTVNVTLDLQLTTPSSFFPPHGILLRLQDAETDSSQPEESSSSQEPRKPTEAQKITAKLPNAPDDKTPIMDTAVLCCLSRVLHPDGVTVDMAVLESHMAEMDEFLLHGTSLSDRSVYKNAKSSTREAIFAKLERGSKTVLSSKPSDGPIREWLKLQRDFEDQVSLFNSADIIARFFLPAGAAVATVDKYWGAIDELIVLPDDDDTEHMQSARSHFPVAVPELRPLATHLMSFNLIFGHVPPSTRHRIQVPVKLLQGWMQLLMGLVYVHSDQYRADTLHEGAVSLIEEATFEILGSLGRKTTPLLDASAMLPQDLLQLMSMGLLQDVMQGLPDTRSIYSWYLAMLESEMATRPSDRSLEQRTRMLQEEVTVIRRILAWQKSILRTCDTKQRAALHPVHVRRHDMHTVYDHADASERIYDRSDRMQHRVPVAVPLSQTTRTAGHQHQYAFDASIEQGADFKMRATDPGGFRSIFLKEALQHLERRDVEFSELAGHATSLEAENRRRIDTTKDRQEQAIFAFTIVTIIFLPLSAVSSIFGMNTKDVRDMEWGQGLYWAVAIPVTVVVIILGLLMTGQLGFIAEWVLRRASRRQKQGGYFTVDDASREVVQGPEYAARFWSADEVEVPRRRRTVSFA